MKTNYYFLLILMCFFLSCNEKEKPITEPPAPEPPLVEEKICACGVEDPAKNLTWLAELIEKAEKDTADNYFGAIWLEKYKGQDVFVSTIVGIMRYADTVYEIFDCEGNRIELSVNEAQGLYNNLKKNIVLYAHPDYPLNTIYACGIADPANNLPWLADLINTMKTDTVYPKGYWVGTIWLEKYHEEDVFVYKRIVGGAMYYVYNCSGNLFEDDGSIPHFKRRVHIFSYPIVY